MLARRSWLLLQALSYATLALASGYLFHRQGLGVFFSDTAQHLANIDPYIHGQFFIPHPGFHLTVYYLARVAALTYVTAAAIVLAAAVLATLVLTQSVISTPATSTGAQHTINPYTAAAALSLCLGTAIYVPFFNEYVYLGQFGPGAWHSPTATLAKPFVLLSFVSFVPLLQASGASPRQYILGSFCFLAGAFVKPSFAIGFLPAMALYLVLFHTRVARLYCKVAIWTLPTLALLAYQYHQTYRGAATGSYYHDRIVLTNFGVFELYTPSVAVSALLVWAFPVSVVAARPSAIQGPTLRLAWFTALIAFLQAGFLAEERNFDEGAFVFGYVIAMFVLYVVSMQEYLGWYRADGPVTGKAARIAVLVVYLAHAVSGTFYFGKMVQGGSFR